MTKAYLDASILVSMFSPDALTPRADGFLRASSPIVIVSDFAAAELAAVISRQTRTSHLSRDNARRVLASFDEWRAGKAESVRLEGADIAVADAFLRRLELSLRAPDAIHVAITQRLGVLLATFDSRLAADARTIGVPVAEA